MLSQRVAELERERESLRAMVFTSSNGNTTILTSTLALPSHPIEIDGAQATPSAVLQQQSM